LSFDTPGSRVDRELTTEFQLDRQRQQVRLDIKTPWKKANIRGSLVNEAALKKALLSATLDETTEYSASAEVQVARDLYLNTLIVFCHLRRYLSNCLLLMFVHYIIRKPLAAQYMDAICYKMKICIFEKIRKL